MIKVSSTYPFNGLRSLAAAAVQCRDLFPQALDAAQAVRRDHGFEVLEEHRAVASRAPHRRIRVSGSGVGESGAELKAGRCHRGALLSDPRPADEAAIQALHVALHE